MLTPIRRVASHLGIGQVAGAAGTAVMTAVQTIEMRATGREPSTMPADAVEEVLDVEPADETSEERLANLTHWAYGTSLGTLRGILGAVGLRPIVADGVFFTLVWGGALTMLPSLGLSSPPTKWGARALLKDAAHHAVYAAAVGAAYRLLARRPQALVDRVVEGVRAAA